MQEASARFRTASEAHASAISPGQSAFLARLAHELRNPLAPIRMALQIMQAAEDDVATSRAARVIIDRQLAQLTHLIEDLADISQLEQGTLKLRCTLTTLKAIVEQGLHLARTQLESRQNKLQIEVPAEALPVFADQRRVSQALANVLVNASKCSEHGAPIQLVATQSAEDISICVTDEGAGLPKSMLTRIFEPFVQVDRDGVAAQDGLGLGLAIVGNVLRAHGGTARAESDGEGRGSRFILQMPRGSAVAPASEHLVEARAADSGRLRILVADDNKDAAQTLAIMLRYEGHDVRTAHDGLEALAVGQLFAPELIFLDIGMPVMDGYQTARQIRERNWGRDVYLVALTGWGRDADREAALAQGFQHHLVKPALPEDLTAVLKDAMRTR